MLLSQAALSFRRYMVSEGRRPQTIRTSLRSIKYLENHVGDADATTIDKEALRAFLDARRASVSVTTVDIEFRALRVFFKWLVEEEEIPSTPFAKLRKPKVPINPPDVYTDDELHRLLNACANSRSRFAGVRDTAIIWTLLDCGMRRSELANVLLDDVHLDERIIFLRVTKNGTPRMVALGAKATLALDRYIRVRNRHPQAFLPQLLLGQAGPMTDNGIYQALRERGTQAGVRGVRPHRFRHTWAHRSLMNGMQSNDLMVLAGWKSLDMVIRYGAAAATERAIAAHRTFSPADRMG